MKEEAMKREDNYYENQWINSQHENTQLRMKVAEYEKLIARLEDANLRLADRNWELQNRVFTSTTLTGT
jgi:hypothetical protein